MSNLTVARNEKHGAWNATFIDPEGDQGIGRGEPRLRGLRRSPPACPRCTGEQEDDNTRRRAQPRVLAYRVRVQSTMTPQLPPWPEPDWVMPYSTGTSAGRR